jgi:Uncharacterized alpha/beta hydrolase domain (DUF2235)
MAMKRLVVCCDGTWNDTDSGTPYTNVSRLAWAIKPVDERDGKDITQIVFYQSGVGSEGAVLDRLKAGALGLGLSHNLRDAYSFVCNNYCDGDEIFLFGFSRGAYTARSLGGLVGYAGLLGKRDLDRFFELWDGYREENETARAAALDKFPDRHAKVPIKCIGVWDTVGSVGIPSEFETLDSVFRKYYGFHNTNLGTNVEHAFHALALDERRKSFVPTLWTKKPGVDQELKQVWFAGVHSDVGGGYPEHGTSDVTLAWMAGQVAPYLGIDFDYLKLRRDLSGKWAMGTLHESFDKFWTKLGEARRMPFAGTAESSCERLHASVVARIKGGGLGADGKPYKSAVLKDAHLDNLEQASALEAGLQWKDAEVKQAAVSPAKTAASLQKKVGNAFGRIFGIG